MRDNKIICLLLGMSIVENLHTASYIWAGINILLAAWVIFKD